MTPLLSLHERQCIFFLHEQFISAINSGALWVKEKQRQTFVASSAKCFAPSEYLAPFTDPNREDETFCANEDISGQFFRVWYSTGNFLLRWH